MKKWIKNWTIMDYIYWGAALLPFVISLLFYSRLPEQVATHWGMDHQINGYSSKNFASWGLPAIIFAITVFVNVVLDMDPKNRTIRRSKEMKLLSKWLIVGIAVVTQLMIMLTGVGVLVPVDLVVGILLSVIFIIIGNYLPKCRQNYLIGIKLPWTLADEENWNKTHRLAGYIWTVGGILMLLVALLKLLYLLFGIIIVMVAIPTIYSYFLYDKKSKEDLQ